MSPLPRWTLTALLLLELTGCQAEQVSVSDPERAWFVDQVEEGRAVLVSEEGEVRRVDAATLPPDAGEGAWLYRGRRDPERERAYRERLRARRQALTAGDDGRDLAL